MPIDTGLVRVPRRSLSDYHTVAIAGDQAASTGEAFARAGAPAPVVESDHFTLLADGDGRPRASRVRDLAPGSVDLVVLRRAWRSKSEVGEAIRAAVGVVAIGGEVVVADVDSDRLLTGPTARYPVRLLYLAEPKAAARLKTSTASPGMLGAEAVRARLRDVDSVRFDEVHGRYDGVAALWSGVRDGGWRGSRWIGPERAAEVFAEVARPLAGAIPVGPAVDREPWYAVVGTRR